MMQLINQNQFSEKPSDTGNTDRPHPLLTELEKIKSEFPDEYDRLSELFRQGDMETVLQIINHRKAVDQLKKLSPLL